MFVFFPALCSIFHTHMARYRPFVLKMPLQTNQPTIPREILLRAGLTRGDDGKIDELNESVLLISDSQM